jgi:hypothetical protein
VKAEPLTPQAKIAERGYRRYEGTRTTGGRWWVVARQLVRSLRKQRAVVVLTVLAAFPTVITGFVMYFAGRGQPGDDYVYKLLMKPYGTFFLALALAMRAGGGAIADDARAGGFQFYFSRPLTHAHYLAGKLVGVGLLVAAVSAAPALLLSLVKIAVSQSGGEAVRGFGLLLRAGALGLTEAAVFSCVMVALSSLMKRRGLVQGAFAASIFLPWLIGAKFRDFTRTPWPALASIPTHLESLAQWLFGIPNEIGDRAMPPLVAVIMLLAIAAAAVWVAWRQLRRVEVVAG